MISCRRHRFRHTFRSQALNSSRVVTTHDKRVKIAVFFSLGLLFSTPFFSLDMFGPSLFTGMYRFLVDRLSPGISQNETKPTNQTQYKPQRHKPKPKPIKDDDPLSTSFFVRLPPPS